MSWYDKHLSKKAQYGNYEHNWSEFESYAESLQIGTDKYRVYADPEKLNFLLEKILISSAKVVFWKAKEDPSLEQKINVTSHRVDQMCDSVIPDIVNGFKAWLYRHDDVDGWWSEFASMALVEGHAAGRFDIRDEIVSEFKNNLEDYIDQYEIYEDVLQGGYNTEILRYAFERQASETVDFLIQHHKLEVVEFISDNDIAADDFVNYVEDFLHDEYDIIEDVATHFRNEFTSDISDWLINDGGLTEDLNFEDLKEKIGYDGSSVWIRLVEKVAKQYGMADWKANFPGIEEVEADVRKAIARMESADTMQKKVIAISLALNVQHYHGNMMDDHMDIFVDDLTTLSQEDLNRLSNLEVKASSNGMIKTAAVSRYRELREYRKRDGGRHYLFEINGKGDWVGFVVNRIPYYGDVYDDPNRFYGTVTDETGEKGKKVGNYDVSWKKVKEVIDPSRDQSSVEHAVVEEQIPQAVKDLQLDLPMNIPPQPKTEGHWSSTESEIKTADSVWTQDQVYCESPDGGPCYDVGKLIDICSNNHVYRVKAEELENYLFENAWGEDLSPMKVLTNPNANRENMNHMKRIRTAKMEYPLLVRASNGLLIDGYHRLARAFLANETYVSVIFIQLEQMEKAKVIDNEKD